MTANVNPYQPPETIEALVDHHAVPRSFDYFALIAWPIVQACNMFLAALFGWGITQDHGRIGIFFAAMWFLVAGWFLCCVRPVSARKLIFGAILLALTQVFPIIQPGLFMARSYVRQNVVNRFELQPRSGERSYDSLWVI